ncbi:hypothetical protein [Actinoplanes sichuanensis]|uniref:Uncharacterized protein n=1 Tax=Actinoplanes sichuanensis TaxID=512349 RepID=A0ABW4AK68_9ACTN|nr:hypothetical protein [Actinoplanes sichuanensis]
MTITVSETDADAERLQYLSDGVRTELLDLGVDDVRPLRAGEAPAGSRGVDLAGVGAFLVTLGTSADAINQAVIAMRNWVGSGRRTPRSVEITVGDKVLRLSDATLAQQDQLVDEFVRAVRAG